MPFYQEEAILYSNQDLTDAQKAQARTNINAISVEEVEELLGIEEEFSVSGEVVTLDIDLKPDTELNVVSKIHRDSTWGESNKLVLHQVSGENFVDLSSYFGGAGTVFEKNGLTATINDDCTLTIKGTNSSTGWTQVLSITSWDSDNSKRVYPAGTYTIPSGLTIVIRAAQYPGNITISGLAGNLQNAFVAPQPFRIVTIYYAVAGSASIDKTIPFGIFRGKSIPESKYEYVGNIYSTTFDNNVYEGEYNWTTGELKDTNGNILAYYEPQSIKTLPGVNYFWTGFGENVVSNKSDDKLSKVSIELGELAPAETITSICDFTLVPTTMQAAYGLCNGNFMSNGAIFQGKEVPILTTKGTLSVYDENHNIKYSKYINPLINHRNISDILTEKGIHKAWSEKFYLNKAPVNKVFAGDYSSTKNITWTWEFTEEDFVNTGIPAKLSDIPMASPCFYNNSDSQNYISDRVYFSQPYPAKFSYDATTGKYTLVAKGVYDSIDIQLTDYSKVYFYYQLETPYDVSDGFAMGISAGDSVTFTEDYTDAQELIDAEIYGTGAMGTKISEYNITPAVKIIIPRNIEDAMSGMENAARMLNLDENASGDATVQGYSWIGDGDGITDYTTQIQSKLDELHTIYNGGTMHFGPGTYPISKSLIVYDNIRIIGNGDTIIE